MSHLTESSSSSNSPARVSSDRDSITTVSSEKPATEAQRHALHRRIGVRETDLSAIFSENVLAKILQVAQRGLQVQGARSSYPESVPQCGPQAGRYDERDAEFWTCGFFPGSIYVLLERVTRFPLQFSCPDWYRKDAYADLLICGRHWSRALNDMSSRTDTHDMGFIVQPALQKDWELTGNARSLESLTKAAFALASRYEPMVGAIRSWDGATNSRYNITDMKENFLVIIDSMCNLDLLFYMGHLIHDESLISIATTHAHTVRNTIFREDSSTFHMLNLDPQKAGVVKARLTNQGYADSSTWSRGQAWAIMGFAQTFLWTRDVVFLDTAIRSANMFLSRLKAAPNHHPFVPAWDFDAPQKDPSESLRDTSAGVIAANGMLLIHQALQSLSDTFRLQNSRSPVAGGDDFLDAALRIVSETLEMSLDRDLASLAGPSAEAKLSVRVNPSSFDAILRNATANNNEHAHKRYWDHGLVYADYYLLEFGNKLCRMGLC